MRAIQYPVKQFTRRILATYKRASDSDKETGRNWYAQANQFASEIGQGDTAKGAGVIAALSPQMPWKLNCELAHKCCKLGIFSGHYGLNCKKAERIWNGETPLDVLGGPKVRAFYQCILSAGKTDEVCVDRHAIAIAMNRTLTDDERKRYLHASPYRQFAEAYRRAAKKLGMNAAELQAITWVTWRREQGIVD